MKKIITSLLLAGLSVPSIADFSWHASEIKRIYPQANGGFVITFKNPSANCTRADNYHYVAANAAGVTPEGVKAMLSVSLTAATLGKPISVYFDKDSQGCYINRLFAEF